MRAHGTHSCFVHGPNPGSVKGGCSCDPCRQANAAYERQRQARTAPPYVAANRARQHLTDLAAQGVGLKTVARLSGVSHGALSKLIYGDATRGQGPSKRIRPSTEKAILGVTAAQVDGGQRTHTADTYRALLDQLTGRGWTATAIAQAIGVRATNLRPRPNQRTVTAAKMAATRNLLQQTPVTRRTRWGTSAEPTWDPETERRDKLRRADAAEQRAAYRAADRVDDLPTIDLHELLEQTWRERAACRLLPDDQTFIFWPGRGDHTTTQAAKSVCLTCPVAQDCLDWALANNEAGIWGGTSEKQRRDMTAGRVPKVAPKPDLKLNQRRCIHCDRLFRPWSATTRFCSRTCAMQHRHRKAIA